MTIEEGKPEDWQEDENEFWITADTKPYPDGVVNIMFKNGIIIYKVKAGDYDWESSQALIKQWQYSDMPEKTKEIMDEHSYFDNDYESLYEVLNNAYFQAAGGKGKERHANNLPFDEQPMQRISQLLHTHKGCLFQAMKKIQESTGMEYKAARLPDRTQSWTDATMVSA